MWNITVRQQAHDAPPDQAAPPRHPQAKRQTMKLFILRHGQAETYASSDAARKLTPAGRQQVQEVLGRTKSELTGIEKLWVSPLQRAQETADVVEAVLGKLPRVTSDLLLPESTPTDVLEMLQLLDGGGHMLVSHQPLVGELVNGLCGKSNGFFHMDTGTLAHIDLEIPAIACGRMVWLH